MNKIKWIKIKIKNWIKNKKKILKMVVSQLYTFGCQDQKIKQLETFIMKCNAKILR